MVSLYKLKKEDRKKEEKRRRDNLLENLKKRAGKFTVHDVASGLAKELETEVGTLYVNGDSIVVRAQSGEEFISDFRTTSLGEKIELDLIMRRYFNQSLTPLVCMKPGGSCPKQAYKNDRGKIVVKELVVTDGLCGKLNRPLRICDDLERRGIISYIEK